MSLRNILLPLAFLPIASGNSDINANPSNEGFTEKIENIQKPTEKWIYVCLKTDSKNSFTHKTILEGVSDPNNTILEFPISQLFQKYGDRNHPLAVRGIKRDFRALLGKDGIERLMSRTKQKLNPRTEEITSDTKYEMGDTLGFTLINPLLKNDFPQYLSDQLGEEGFEGFSDIESSTIAERISDKKNHKDKNAAFIYDIVVKKAPSGRDALAVY